MVVLVAVTSTIISAVLCISCIEGIKNSREYMLEREKRRELIKDRQSGRGRICRISRSGRDIEFNRMSNLYFPESTVDLLFTIGENKEYITRDNIIVSRECLENEEMCESSESSESSEHREVVSNLDIDITILERESDRIERSHRLDRIENRIRGRKDKRRARSILSDVNIHSVCSTPKRISFDPVITIIK